MRARELPVRGDVFRKAAEDCAENQSSGIIDSYRERA
jgi:hypothetical protein